MLDALGSIGIKWNNVHVQGDCTTSPAYGLVIGRLDVTANNGGGSNMVFNQPLASGCFSTGSYYNFSGEGVTRYDPDFTNNIGFATIDDPFNHFNITSTFVTELAPVDSGQSFNKNTVINGHFKTGTGSSPIWWGGGRGHRISAYGYTNSGNYCATIYNEAPVAGNGGSYDNVFELNCEGPAATDEYLISGNISTVVMTGLSVKESVFQYSNSMFKLGGSVTSASCVGGCNISVAQVAPAATARTFDAAQSWTAWSGTVNEAVASMWNEPNGWSGSVTLAGNTWNYPDRPGPVDFLGTANGAGAWSSARHLSRSYTGPIINVRNVTSSAAIDVYSDIANLPQGTLASFIAGATGAFVTEYNQDGSATGNLNQSTTASQPSQTVTLSNLNNRNVAQFGDGGALALPSAGTISGIFSAGGFCSSVVNQTGTPTVIDRIWNHGSTSLFYASGSSATLEFLQTASTTNGSWVTPALTNGGHIVDIQYNASATANVPTIAYDGVSQSFSGTPQQPIGTITPDSGQFIVGNSAATGGNRGFIGSIAEVVCSKAITVSALDAVRRNQAAYYGLTSVP